MIINKYLKLLALLKLLGYYNKKILIQTKKFLILNIIYKL